MLDSEKRKTAAIKKPPLRTVERNDVMNSTVTNDYTGKKFNIELPNTCPFCGTTLIPDIFGVSFGKSKHPSIEERYVDLILSCPKCENRFFASYDKGIGIYMELQAVYPPPTPKIELPKIVLEKYPDFHDAYHQAAVAETHGLNPLCGMGYRRALEILIKQHLIGLHPDEQDTIMSETLAQSYNRLDDKEKALARGAAWLGNDYAHMVNKHPEYDIDDLKNFIHALSYLIAAYLTAEEADNVPRA